MPAEVLPALKVFLEERKDQLDESLALINKKFKRVFIFEREDLDVEMYPCIMFGNPSWRKTWVAAPYEIETRYEVPISAYIVYDDNEMNAMAMIALATTISLMFEPRDAEEIDIPGRYYKIHYHSEPPMDEGQLDYQLIGGAFCRACHFTWHGYVTRSTWNHGINAAGGANP